MKLSTRSLLVSLCLTVLSMTSSWAYIFANFEEFVGQDGQAVNNWVTGLVIESLDIEGITGPVWIADINTGNYNVNSDNGKIFPVPAPGDPNYPNPRDGSYFVGGDVAVFTDELSAVKISFTFGNASFFRAGYSSQYTFHLKAYDANGVLLNYVQGGSNVYPGSGGGGLAYLQVSTSTPNIAYVILHDAGGRFFIDNIETDAPEVIPEPFSLLTFAAGVFGLLGMRKRR